MNSAEIAIDFGTARTKVAWFDPKAGKSELIELGRDNPRFIPSIFYVGTEESGGEIFVGDDARQRLFDDPLGIILGLKLDIDNPRKITVGSGRPRVRRIDLLTRLFAHIREVCSSHHFQAEVTSCTITVPVVFEEPKREAIRQAAQAAGFHEIRLLEEPVAAALAWLAEKPDHVPDHIVVCDVGGGTTDFALVHHAGDRFRPDPKVPPFGFPAGGNALDEDIWRELKSAGNGDVDVAKQNYFLDEIRKAKERLDNMRGDAVILGAAEQVRLSSDLIKTCCSNFVEDIGEELDGFLTKCRTEAGIEEPAVLLVGGSAKLHGLKERVERTGSRAYQWLKSEWAPVLGAALPKNFRPDQAGAGVVGHTAEDIKYREAIRVAWRDRVIEESELNNLMGYAQELGVSDKDAAGIEREVIGQSKEEAYRAGAAEAYSSILEDTKKLIQAGRGREAFEKAEKALVATCSDDALDAWINAMDTLSSGERILGSAEEISGAVASIRPDVAVFVRVIAHLTAEAKEIDTDKILAWLEPLDEEVRTYAHALALLFYLGEAEDGVSERWKSIMAFARELRPSSETLDMLEFGQNAGAEDGQYLLDSVRRLRKYSQSPAMLMIDYFFDLKFRQLGATESSEFSEWLVSEERRAEIVRQLRHIAADSFSQRLVTALHAFHERRYHEFMSASEEVLKSPFCAPIFGANLWELRSRVYMNEAPPNYEEAVSCLEKTVSLDKDEDGSFVAQLSGILVGWANTVFAGDEQQARQISNRAIKVCEDALALGKEGAELRNQTAYSMLDGIGYWIGMPRVEQLIRNGYAQSLKNIETSPEDDVGKAIHFSFCGIKEAPGRIMCVFPYIPPATMNGAFEKYLGHLHEGESVLFLYDAAIVNSGQVGVTVTPLQIVANTRFSGVTQVTDWESKSAIWNGSENKLIVGGVEVPYGNEIGQELGKILNRYKTDLWGANRVK